VDYLPELRAAILRFITDDGATVVDIADSFNDLEGFTPYDDKLTAGLDRLVAGGELTRTDDGRYFRTGGNPYD
jgi:hypothetical protein